MITADEVRRVIVEHDASRPRSQQTAIGPSDLSSPCSRRIAYQILGVPRQVSSDVNLYAYVGTGLHRQLADACEADNERLGRRRWETEMPVSVPVTDAVVVPGSADAYDHDTASVIDWKSRGASKPSQVTRDKHHQQLAWYGLGVILAGHPITTQSVVYIPRNGTLSHIEVDTRPFDQEVAEAALRRYEQLLAAAAAGPSVLPLLPVAHDCKFCAWWVPGHDDLTTGCPGQPPTDATADIPPWEPQGKEGERA